MKTELEIIYLAEQQVINHPDYLEDYTDYHNGLLNGFIEGYKSAQSQLYSLDDIKKAINFIPYEIQYDNLVASLSEKEIEEFIQSLKK